MGGRVVANLQGDGPWRNLAPCTSVWTFTRTASTLPRQTPGATARCDTSARIGGDLASLDKSLRKLISKGHALHVVYEAGPCGFVIWRHLNVQGLRCEVVAPSSIPKRSGDRVKTDRRDAMHAGPTGARRRAERGARARCRRRGRARPGARPRRCCARAAQRAPSAQGAAAAQRHHLRRQVRLERRPPALAGHG